MRYANVHASLFNGLATSARYADLAERYHADDHYDAGTVVILGGKFEITQSTVAADPRVAGIISTAPALMMNCEAGDDVTHPYVALRGRVPCRVIGRIEKGDILVTSHLAGHAMKGASGKPSAIIGKAIEPHDSDGAGVIEVLV